MSFAHILLYFTEVNKGMKSSVDPDEIAHMRHLNLHCLHKIRSQSERPEKIIWVGKKQLGKLSRGTGTIYINCFCLNCCVLFARSCHS